LAGKVDLIRINDIRRTLRIRYAARNDVQKLFGEYDLNNKGYIDAGDVYAKSDHLGIKISLNEAQVLVQCAKKTEGSEKGLNVEEFGRLMFDCDETLKVDLDKLQPMSRHYDSKPPTGHSVKSKNVVENQWKFYLQKSLKNICNDLLRDDTQRSYFAD